MLTSRFTFLFYSVLILLSPLKSCRTSRPSIPESSKSILPYYPLKVNSDLDPLIREIADADVVLLGESTHGTHEYYEWRARITKRLVAEKNFNLMAIEGDWTDADAVNEFIKRSAKHPDSVLAVLKGFDRWPSSMWGNHEMLAMIEWLNKWNQTKVASSKVGFYGLDLYGFWEWTKQDITGEPEFTPYIKRVHDFFSVFGNDAQLYSESIRKGKAGGQDLTKALWEKVSDVYSAGSSHNNQLFLLYQLAELTRNGEEFFRIMNVDRVRAVNLRDNYMAATIARLLDFHGKKAKMVVWLHNGHAGNAKYSASASAGYTSVGEILIQKMGERKVYTVGFGTYRGTVRAGYNWNATITEQEVPPAKAGSWEDILHRIHPGNMLLLSSEMERFPELNRWIELRSIGAVYSGAALYNLSVIPKRFNAFIFFDSTGAIMPLQD